MSEEENNSIHVDVGIIKAKLEDILKRLESMQNVMATRQWVDEQLQPIRMLVYGCVGLMLTAIVGGIMASLFK